MSIEEANVAMVVFLFLNVLHGLYRIEQNMYRNKMVTAMWVTYTFFAALFFVGVAIEVKINEVALFNDIVNAIIHD